MKKIIKSEFEKNSLKTDKLFPNYGSQASFGGVFDKTIRFINENQLYDIELWDKFAKLFSFNSDDGNLGWRCEYWGKTMRGAAFIYSYTKDEKLYKILEDSVRLLLTFQDDLGRFSTYSAQLEFNGWDMWGRKYVLLGLQYFSEICEDNSLKETINKAMCLHADYIISKIGENKIPINKTSSFWRGINSMSILEPFVRLYNKTKEQKYLDFASYIVEIGESSDANIFKLAYEDNLKPFEYPVQKAYEMMSCFEGLIEYYRVTSIEKHRIAALNFGKRLIETDVTIIGCSGCTNELLDNSAINQTNIDFVGIMQETCVSVTWMMLCYQLLRLSGSSVYADCIEQTFYNAYLGSVNTHKNMDVMPSKNNLPESKEVLLPFDSYSPLRNGVRGEKVGGLMRLDDNTFYGCCACIGAAGIGIIPKVAVLLSAKGFSVNMYIDGNISTTTPNDNNVIIKMITGYPYKGNVDMKIAIDISEEFTISLRIPKWSKTTFITVCGENIQIVKGYTHITRVWENGDDIKINFDLNAYLIKPLDDNFYFDSFVAIRKGCIVFATDARLGINLELPVSIESNRGGIVDYRKCSCPEIPESLECIEIQQKDGSKLRLVDYSSAGKTWSDESKCAVWLPQTKTIIHKG